MAQNLQVGQNVYVATHLLPEPDSFDTAIATRQVSAIQDRSARVSLPGGAISDLIATSKLHVKLKILVLRIGDMETETMLLDPLAKSVLHFLRLFMDDQLVHLLEVRSLDELQLWWGININAYSHVVLIGHGDMENESIKFAVGGNKSAADFGLALNVPVDQGLVFVSLACRSGLACFAKPFSLLPFCSAFIAPFHSIPAAIGSQFCQTFFANHLGLAESVAVSYRHARAATPGVLRFKLWRDGERQPVGS
jgi:hypothetical protein